MKKARSCGGLLFYTLQMLAVTHEHAIDAHRLYGAGAVDATRFLAEHLLLAHSRAACIGPLSRVELAIARRLSCSDFRLTSHASHNRTERALQLASQHVVAGAAVLVLQELSLDPVAQVSIGHP